MPTRTHINTPLYHFDDVAVDRETFRIHKGDQTRTLTPRAFDLLVYLIEHRNRVVQKQELFEEIWKEAFVTDNALTRAIKDIRRVIGDDADAPRYIETVPKRGYRFIAEIETPQETKLEALKTKTGLIDVANVGIQAVHSVAVLPFANLNADPEQDYFVQGMTDLLITDLSKIGSLKVISRTSVMGYKGVRKPLPEIAQELNVDAVAEGSVLRVGERVRITVQLIEAATDRHLWAESYERDLHDVLTLQSELALSIAREIHVTLTPEEKLRLASARAVNPEEHVAYLKGHYFLNKYSSDGALKATDYFQLAIEKDPNYAAAYAGLADAYGMLAFWGFTSPREVIPKVRAAVLKALEMDDTLGEAHSVLARLMFYCDWDWVAAEREFKRAIKLNANDTDARLAYSFELAVMGRLDEGMEQIRRAWELDPLSLVANCVVGWHFYASRRYEEAIAQWQKTVEMEPNFFISHRDLWRVFWLKRRYEAALDECRKAFTLLGHREVVKAIEDGYAESGYKGAMRQAAETLVAHSNERYVPPSDIALFCVHANERDEAIDWLEKAYEGHDLKLYTVGVEPDWESLHPDARFQALLQRLKLPVVVTNYSK
jgi:TolB-like protein